MFEDEEGDITYLDKSFDKVLVNFMGTKTTYLKCHSFFLSKLKLYKQVKAGYIKKTLPPSFTQPSLSIPIIMSKIIHQS